MNKPVWWEERGTRSVKRGYLMGFIYDHQLRTTVGLVENDNRILPIDITRLNMGVPAKVGPTDG